MFVGSTDFAAPEQVRGEETDARTDVYALGCVLFELLTRNVPFDRASDMAKMYAHITEPPPRVTAWRPDLAGRPRRGRLHARWPRSPTSATSPRANSPAPPRPRSASRRARPRPRRPGAAPVGAQHRLGHRPGRPRLPAPRLRWTIPPARRLVGRPRRPADPPKRRPRRARQQPRPPRAAAKRPSTPAGRPRRGPARPSLRPVSSAPARGANGTPAHVGPPVPATNAPAAAPSATPVARPTVRRCRRGRSR